MLVAEVLNTKEIKHCFCPRDTVPVKTRNKKIQKEEEFEERTMTSVYIL